MVCRRTSSSPARAAVPRARARALSGGRLVQGGSIRTADGKLDHAEFMADAVAFFGKLDLNSDGVLDPYEIQVYEHRVAPEVLGYRVNVDRAQSAAAVARPDGPRASGEQVTNLRIRRRPRGWTTPASAPRRLASSPRRSPSSPPTSTCAAAWRSRTSSSSPSATSPSWTRSTRATSCWPSCPRPRRRSRLSGWAAGAPDRPLAARRRKPPPPCVQHGAKPACALIRAHRIVGNLEPMNHLQRAAVGIAATAAVLSVGFAASGRRLRLPGGQGQPTVEQRQAWKLQRRGDGAEARGAAAAPSGPAARLPGLPGRDDAAAA